jgi:hypothetical protein
VGLCVRSTDRCIGTTQALNDWPVLKWLWIADCGGDELDAVVARPFGWAGHVADLAA